MSLETSDSDIELWSAKYPGSKLTTLVSGMARDILKLQHACQSALDFIDSGSGDLAEGERHRALVRAELETVLT